MPKDIQGKKAAKDIQEAKGEKGIGLLFFHRTVWEAVKDFSALHTIFQEVQRGKEAGVG